MNKNKFIDAHRNRYIVSVKRLTMSKEKLIKNINFAAFSSDIGKFKYFLPMLTKGFLLTFFVKAIVIFIKPISRIVV
jgi:hypothetical protein